MKWLVQSIVGGLSLVLVSCAAVTSDTKPASRLVIEVELPKRVKIGQPFTYEGRLTNTSKNTLWIYEFGKPHAWLEVQDQDMKDVERHMFGIDDLVGGKTTLKRGKTVTFTGQVEWTDWQGDWMLESVYGKKVQPGSYWLALHHPALPSFFGGSDEDPYLKSQPQRIEFYR